MKWKNSIIKKHLDSKAYSYKDFCDYVNITEEMLKNWLHNGYVTKPHIRRISEMCDIPLQDLINERELNKGGKNA